MPEDRTFEGLPGMMLVIPPRTVHQDRVSTAYSQFYVRLERALELIRRSSLSLENVATLCGYYSASPLNRSVKRATGRTPGHFRPPRAGTVRGSDEL